MSDPHPLAAATGGGLDQYREIDLLGDLHSLLIGLDQSLREGRAVHRREGVLLALTVLVQSLRDELEG